MRWLLFILCLSAAFYTCVNPPNFPETPVITFKNVDRTFINENTDSVRLMFSFTDGDGDLGLTQSDTSTNTFVTDIRSGKKDFTYRYRLPYVTPGGMIKDISGDITITLPGVTCVPGKTLDSVVYKIQIKDRAGHLSNIIQSPQLIVKCQ